MKPPKSLCLCNMLVLLVFLSGFSNARMFWMGSNGANQNNPDGINTGNGHAWVSLYNFKTNRS